MDNIDFKKFVNLYHSLAVIILFIDLFIYMFSFFRYTLNDRYWFVIINDDVFVKKIEWHY